MLLWKDSFKASNNHLNRQWVWKSGLQGVFRQKDYHIQTGNLWNCVFWKMCTKLFVAMCSCISLDCLQHVVRVNECRTSPRICIISNAHVILHVSHLIKLPVFSQWVVEYCPICQDTHHWTTHLIAAMSSYCWTHCKCSLHAPIGRGGPQRDPTHQAQHTG